MPFDDGALAMKAVDRASLELYDLLMLIAKTRPDVFRHGVTAYFVRQPTSAQKTQKRQEIAQAGQADPNEMEKLLSGMVKDTSFQEVLDLMSSGRLPAAQQGGE